MMPKTPERVLANPRRPSLGEYLSFLQRRRRTVVAVTVIVTAIVAAAVFVLPPAFTANTSLFVRFGREFIYRPEVGEPGTSPAFRLAEIVNSEVEILNSQDLARQVVEELGVAALYPKHLAEEDPARQVGKAVAEFQSKITTVAVLESSIIKVSFDHPDPQIAARALNLLVDRFLEKHLEIFSEGKTEFILAQLKRNEETLGKAENDLAAFKIDSGISLLPEQKRMFLTRCSDLDATRFTVELEIADLRERLKVLPAPAEDELKKLAGPPPIDRKEALAEQRRELLAKVQENELRIIDLEGRLSTATMTAKAPAATFPILAGTDRFRFLDEALVRLLDLELKEKEVLRDYREDSREVKGVRNGIGQIEGFLVGKGSHAKALMDGVIEDELTACRSRRAALRSELDRIDSMDAAITVSELALLESKRARIDEEIDRLEKVTEGLDGGEKRMRELERQVAIDEQNVRVLMEKYQEAQISDELDRRKMVNIRVVDRASVPLFETGPSKALKLCLGAFIGLLAGITIAFFKEMVQA